MPISTAGACSPQIWNTCRSAKVIAMSTNRTLPSRSTGNMATLPAMVLPVTLITGTSKNLLVGLRSTARSSSAGLPMVRSAPESRKAAMRMPPRSASTMVSWPKRWRALTEEVKGGTSSKCDFCTSRRRRLKSRVSRWFLSRSIPRMPSAPIAALGSTGISTSFSVSAPILTSGTTAVGVSSTPATPCSGRMGPSFRESAVAISRETTDWLAPVSTTKK